MQPEYVAVATVAARLNLSRHAVYAAIKRGDLAAVRFGRAVRVRVVDVDTWLRAAAVVPSAPPALRMLPASSSFTAEDEAAWERLYGNRKRRVYRQDSESDRRAMKRGASARHG